MSTEGLQAVATVVHELRWVLVFLGFLFFAGLLAEANHRVSQEKARAAELEQRLLAQQPRRHGVVALPPRKGTETDHG